MSLLDRGFDSEEFLIPWCGVISMLIRNVGFDHLKARKQCVPREGTKCNELVL